MPNRDTLLDSLADYMGNDREAAEELLSNADVVSQQNRDNGVIVREGEVEEEVQPTEEDEIVEEQDVETEEEVEELEEFVDEIVEVELGDEFVGEVAELVTQSIDLQGLMERLSALEERFLEQAEDENDDRPVRQRRVIRPTLRRSGENEGETATEPVARQEVDKNDKLTISQRRAANLNRLRGEQPSSKKLD